MSDIQERQQTDFEPMNPGSPGKLLKSERERQGLSLEEVSIQLNLRPAVVAGLEADQYDEVPISAYRRGYLRAYARLMGIDEREVVDAYNSKHGRSEVERKVTPVHTAKTPSRAGPWIFKLVTVLVILGLIALTLLWWQSRDGNDIFDGLGLSETTEMESFNEEPMSDDAGDATTGDVATASEEDSDLPPLPAEDEVLGLVEDDTVNDESVSATQSASNDEATDNDAGRMIEPATAPDMTDTVNDTANESAMTQSEEQATANEGAEAAPAAASPDSRRLAFVFNEESWTEVFDASGERILVGLQAAGTEATAEGEPPFRLTIGNASGVELRYRDEVVDLGPRAAGTNVARFTLGE